MRISTLLATTALGFAAGSVAYAQTIRVEGVSAGSVLTQAALLEYKKQNSTARIEIGVAGSAGALAKLCAREAALAIAARPISKEELAFCDKQKVEFVEVPIAFDAITVVVNRRNDFVDTLSLEELRRIWEASARGKVTRWNQINARFPDTPLKLLGPDSQFERTSTFTEAVLGPGQAARRDYMASVDEDVLTRGVARDPNALAYVSLAAYAARRKELKSVPIVIKTGGEAVKPTLDNVARGLYPALSRPVFLYASVKALDAVPVREFAEFFVRNGARFAQVAELVPLPDSAYQQGLARLTNRSKGTVWEGTIPLNLSPAEVQKRQAAF